MSNASLPCRARGRYDGRYGRQLGRHGPDARRIIREEGYPGSGGERTMVRVLRDLEARRDRRAQVGQVGFRRWQPGIGEHVIDVLELPGTYRIRQLDGQVSR